MKWKLTGRYLFSILTIVFIVLIVNTVIVLVMLVQQHSTGIDEVSDEAAETFTRGFSQYMALEDGEPTISEEGKTAIENYGAWIQVLDDSGNVLSSHLAPDTVSLHYSPMEIVHKYKYMDDEFNTYFLGAFEGFSYIVGIPYSDEQRYVFTANPASVFSYLTQLLFIIIVVDLIIAAIIGLLFSTILTKPVNTMIERVSQLKKRNFKAHHPKKPGIYKPVFSNLNDVSATLKKHEDDRMRLETMRNEWISNVSHDLKTPLASVQGYAELLRDEDVSSRERLEYAAVIEKQSIYMKDLLDDLNLTMRLRNEEMPLQLKETRIEPFIKEIVIDLLNDPQFSDYDISFTSDASSLTLAIDQHLLKRAILNFAYNALIHNDKNVTISLTITNQFISIEDNGKGISDDLDHVFDRYYRGTNTNNVKGTGLGMAIARDIVEAHGATVELNSQVGKGTIVTIWYKAT